MLPGAGVGVFKGGSAGASCPSYTHIQRDTHRRMQTHADSHIHSHIGSLLTVCCWELVPFVWPQKGPVTGLNGPPAPTEHDSFRQLMPQACLVPVLATSAEQVVRRVQGLGGTCPEAPADPLPAGPRRLPLEAAPQQRMAISRHPQEALLCPSWARDGSALQAPTPPHPAGPTLAHPASSTFRSGKGPYSIFWLQTLAGLQRLSCVWCLHWP